MYFVVYRGFFCTKKILLSWKTIPTFCTVCIFATRLCAFFFLAAAFYLFFFLFFLLSYAPYGGRFLLLRIETSPLIIRVLFCFFFVFLFTVWAEPGHLNNKKFTISWARGLIAVSEENGGILWAVSTLLFRLDSICIEMKMGALLSLLLFSHESSHLGVAGSNLQTPESSSRAKAPHQRGDLITFKSQNNPAEIGKPVWHVSTTVIHVAKVSSFGVLVEKQLYIYLTKPGRMVLHVHSKLASWCICHWFTLQMELETVSLFLWH